MLHTAARGVAHVAQCVEFFRGSRVEDYQPLSHLLSKLATPALVAPAQQAIPARPPASEQALLKSSTEAQAAAVVEEAAVAATAPQAAHHQLPEVQEFVAPSLSEQALRLLQAFVAGHDQVGTGSAYLSVQQLLNLVCLHAWDPLLHLAYAWHLFRLLHWALANTLLTSVLSVLLSVYVWKELYGSIWQ